MKKSVLIPFHKYQYFQKLQDNSENTELRKEPATQEVSIETKELAVEDKELNKLNKDIILCHIPKTKKTKVEALLQYIEKSPDLDWNSKGEITVKGESIPGSHISDLVKDSVTEFKHFEPLGVEEFYKNIGNIPLTIITNPKRRDLLQRGGKFSQSIPPGIPVLIKPRILKTVETVEKEVKKPVKESWKNMWKNL